MTNFTNDAWENIANTDTHKDQVSNMSLFI